MVDVHNITGLAGSCLYTDVQDFASNYVSRVPVSM